MLPPTFSLHTQTFLQSSGLLVIYRKPWKISKTVLVDKEKGEESDITSFIPVGLANILYKL